MAKKNQTNARRNNTQAGRRVVNFYNDGTVNIDARQDRSRSQKIENNGCTINYPYHPAANKIGDYINHISHFASEASTEVAEHPTEAAELPNKEELSVETGQTSEAHDVSVIEIVANAAIGGLIVGALFSFVKYLTK